MIEDPQAIANNYIVDFDHPHLGNILIPGYPASFSANSAGMRNAAPGLGEHTEQVMKEMGLTDSEIAELKESSVIK